MHAVFIAIDYRFAVFYTAIYVFVAAFCWSSFFRSRFSAGFAVHSARFALLIFVLLRCCANAPDFFPFCFPFFPFCVRFSFHVFCTDSGFWISHMDAARLTFLCWVTWMLPRRVSPCVLSFRFRFACQFCWSLLGAFSFSLRALLLLYPFTALVLPLRFAVLPPGFCSAARGFCWIAAVGLPFHCLLPDACRCRFRLFARFWIAVCRFLYRSRILRIAGTPSLLDWIARLRVAGSAALPAYLLPLLCPTYTPRSVAMVW